MARVFPITGLKDDPRFTFGLLIDVAEVLGKHGYQDMTAPYDGVGPDLVDLRQALFGFLYTIPFHSTGKDPR